MKPTASRLHLPPTRSHRQFAAWINAQGLIDERGRPVLARVERVVTSTDQKISGTRLRRPGRGRRGLLLEICPVGAAPLAPDERLYAHTSSETYRKHSEARVWVEQNLRKKKK